VLVSLPSNNSRGGWTQSLDRGIVRQAFYHCAVAFGQCEVLVLTFGAMDFGIDMKIFNSNKNISYWY
jgi:hypothetical protein